ncbi:MAG: hypothetical protein R6V85_01270, partial [Polyangia bacterium]
MRARGDVIDLGSGTPLAWLLLLFFALAPAACNTGSPPAGGDDSSSQASGVPDPRSITSPRAR